MGGFPADGDVPYTRYSPIPAILALVPSNDILQPHLQQDNHHHRQRLRREPCERHKWTYLCAGT